MQRAMQRAMQSRRTYTTDTNYFFSFGSFGLKKDVILAIPLVLTFLSASTPLDPATALRFVAPVLVFFSLTIGAAAAAAAAARSARYALRDSRLKVSSWLIHVALRAGDVH